MSCWLISFRLLTVIACSPFEVHAFAADGTLEKSRPVTDRRGLDLSNKTTAAIRSDDERTILKIRCIPKIGLSAEVDLKRSSMRFGPNAEIRITYRAGEGPVSEDKAWPAGAGRATLPNGRQILEDLLKGSALHIQVDVAGGASGFMVFRPKNETRAFEKMQSDCPEDAPPPDQNGLAR